MSHVPNSDEVAAAVLEPHFDAVRDTFSEFEAESGVTLSKLKKVKMIVDPSVHDSPRHFAQCRDDGMLIKLAPQAAKLPWENLVAILLHEFGHAADFAYPAMWVTSFSNSDPAVWVGMREDKYTRKWRNLWNVRNDDQVECSADAIAHAVAGISIKYCGPCMVQCFSGADRPGGLR